MWKSEKCEEKIINHLKNTRNRYLGADQDILNILFRKKIKYLDLKYNFNCGFYIYGIKESIRMYGLKPPYYYSIKKIEKAHNNPIIYHCMGAVTGRPWEKNNIHPQNNLFDNYLKKTPWKNFSKTIVIKNKIFRVQRFLYQILPRVIYVPIHYFILNLYLIKLSNNSKNFCKNKKSVKKQN